MRTRRIVTVAAGAVAVLALSAVALAQTPTRRAQPTKPAPAQPSLRGAQLPYTTLLTNPRINPRAARVGQYPMPIARTDVSRFNMPVAGGDPVNYPIRIIRPGGEAIALETTPPTGVPVEPKLLEPVRLKIAPARPSLSK